MDNLVSPPSPFISVIVPLYNVGPMGAMCIASLQSQTFRNFEVIVVDDGSTDDSYKLAQSAATGDLRFQFLNQENKGLSAARNAGLEQTRGDFIAFVDSDDRVHPRFLEDLYEALTQSSADWVACAVKFVAPGANTGVDHPAIHGVSPDNIPSNPHLYSFTDWGQIVRHFPSAWNKLYRKRLIEGLRFDEGTYFEDHAFFYRVASRTDHMLYLPQPLYWQTQGRPGQITQDGSERVFDQFGVLLTMKRIMQTARHLGWKRAFSQISTRLMFERSQAVKDPTLRARFIKTCRDFMTRHELSFAADWDESIGRTWERVLRGETPLSIIVPFNRLAPNLQRSLDALSEDSFYDAETILVQENGTAETQIEATCFLQTHHPHVSLLHSSEMGVSGARNLGVGHAKGDFVIFLDAGDIIYPGMLQHWVEQMIRYRADFGFAGFCIGPTKPIYHNGFHDIKGLETKLRTGPFGMSPETSLKLHPLPSSKIFRRSFLEQNAIAFPEEPLASWAVCLWAANCAERILYFADPGVELSDLSEDRQLWLNPETPQALAWAINRIAQGSCCDDLPNGWQRRLFLRAVWEKARFASHANPSERERFITEAGRLLDRFMQGQASQPDPYIDPTLLETLGISTSSTT